MGLRNDTRGASITLTHSLTIGITTLLIAGLLLGAGSLLDRQQERVTKSGLHDIGEQVVSDLTTVDTLASEYQSSTVSSQSGYPARIGGNLYEVGLRADGDDAVVFMNMSNPQATVRITFQNTSRVCEREINGGPVKIVYNGSGQNPCLQIARANR